MEGDRESSSSIPTLGTLSRGESLACSFLPPLSPVTLVLNLLSLAVMCVFPSVGIALGFRAC